MQLIFVTMQKRLAFVLITGNEHMQYEAVANQRATAL
jgi:hypothetical protein